MAFTVLPSCEQGKALWHGEYAHPWLSEERNTYFWPLSEYRSSSIGELPTR